MGRKEVTKQIQLLKIIQEKDTEILQQSTKIKHLTTSLTSLQCQLSQSQSQLQRIDSQNLQSHTEAQAVNTANLQQLQHLRTGMATLQNTIQVLQHDKQQYQRKAKIYLMDNQQLTVKIIGLKEEIVRVGVEAQGRVRAIREKNQDGIGRLIQENEGLREEIQRIKDQCKKLQQQLEDQQKSNQNLKKNCSQKLAHVQHLLSLHNNPTPTVPRCQNCTILSSQLNQLLHSLQVLQTRYHQLQEQHHSCTLLLSKQTQTTVALEQIVLGVRAENRLLWERVAHVGDGVGNEKVMGFLHRSNNNIKLSDYQHENEQQKHPQPQQPIHHIDQKQQDQFQFQFQLQSQQQSQKQQKSEEEDNMTQEYYTFKFQDEQTPVPPNPEISTTKQLQLQQQHNYLLNGNYQILKDFDISASEEIRTDNQDIAARA